jgi:hypothetical protein
VRESFLRCGAAALVAIALWTGLQVVAVVWLCRPHHVWQRRQAGDMGVVLDGGERIARPGDAIFVCEAPHRSGPIVWHLDVDCFCAPEGLTADQVGQQLGGSCALDKIRPTPADATGACRFARCTHHLGVD